MEITVDGIYTFLFQYADIIRSIINIIIILTVFAIIFRVIKRSLLKKAKTKKDISTTTVFLDLLKYSFILLILIFSISSYYGHWEDIGFIAGLLTVALGWALQKPISGVVAWVIIITKRPFHIGDRIEIDNVKGDITDISLTHIYLDEIGGTILGEEQSDRTIMLPTSIIFDTEIINYNHKDNMILDEVTVSITYESNLEKAEGFVIKAAKTILEPLKKHFLKQYSNKPPHTRLQFKDSGIDVTVRYHTIATSRNQISTDIRREIYNLIRTSSDVEFAYPHAEVLFREK
jgi:small-conductance mechanosensitive channel